MASDTAGAALTARLARIRPLTDELARTPAGSVEARALAERIKHAIGRASSRLTATYFAGLEEPRFGRD